MPHLVLAHWTDVLLNPSVIEVVCAAAFHVMIDTFGRVS